ncbi:hypothetical protein BD626DRAFT_411139 [Schizophyllum amplum]|uniref:Uncharacterized protein n=1 Tax=Schizophyllum amplum TaxID=97359 RepID=A0A550BZI5_9AGAR|nr:hypothetical protein BD626DRAFT_411139 [Auriculariopsis ampla]
MSNGLVHNTARRAHKGVVTLIGFLAIPKSASPSSSSYLSHSCLLADQEHQDSATFRSFRRKLFHGSLSHILSSLKPGMQKPELILYGDGHYRKTVYALGPYIADYPEQVLLACVVQGWCPRCTASPDDLRRSPEHTDALLKALDRKKLWDDYGIIHDCKVLLMITMQPFTHDFPPSNIHELLSPDLLHQIIKGSFKDHLVAWLCDYIKLTHAKDVAERILADIDRRIAATPYFPGLRRFPQGRGFKQWTGDDSKALMKVYLPAIVGYVPPQMVRALSAFLDFCYLVCRNSIDEDALSAIEDALSRYHQEREIFRQEGLRDDFALPQQHSMTHYASCIREFGAPNGLCSLITESKHIKAVKEPWRRSSRHQALAQMLVINKRLDKLAACREDFKARGMLSAPLLGWCDASDPGSRRLRVERMEEEEDQGGDDRRDVMGEVILAATRIQGLGPRDVQSLAYHFNIPTLPDLIRRFLYEQDHPKSSIPLLDIPLNDCPPFTGRLHVVGSAITTFYAPSDQCGVGGMHHERIRSTHSWRGGPARRDCIFVSRDNVQAAGFRGMHAARVLLFFQFRSEHDAGYVYPCALVTWFSVLDDTPCKETGMWLVEPDLDAAGNRVMSVIHVDAILRGAHLIGAAGDDKIPLNFSYTRSLDSFRAFYINKYADHHSHEIAF